MRARSERPPSSSVAASTRLRATRRRDTSPELRLRRYLCEWAFVIASIQSWSKGPAVARISCSRVHGWLSTWTAAFGTHVPITLLGRNETPIGGDRSSNGMSSETRKWTENSRALGGLWFAFGSTRTCRRPLSACLKQCALRNKSRLRRHSSRSIAASKKALGTHDNLADTRRSPSILCQISPPAATSASWSKRRTRYRTPEPSTRAPTSKLAERAASVRFALPRYARSSSAIASFR